MTDSGKGPGPDIGPWFLGLLMCDLHGGVELALDECAVTLATRKWPGGRWLLEA